jgi:hypothetical protein
MQTHLRRTQAAKYIKENYGFGTCDTLAKLACVGGGPKFRKLGRFPVYTIEDLEAWIQSRMTRAVSNTSELGNGIRKPESQIEAPGRG